MSKNKIELKKEYESGTVVITKDNIHLYYEFMSDDDIKEYSSLIDDIFEDRLDLLLKEFKSLEYNQITTDKYFTFFVSGLICFGTKDTLKPIDEYIVEIKASEEYKAYTGSLNIPSKEEMRKD